MSDRELPPLGDLSREDTTLRMQDGTDRPAFKALCNNCGGSGMVKHYDQLTRQFDPDDCPRCDVEGWILVPLSWLADPQCAEIFIPYTPLTDAQKAQVMGMAEPTLDAGPLVDHDNGKWGDDEC